MTAPRDETDRRIADDILPAQIDEPAVPVELNVLLPWHKPRKQLVRERQWLHFSRHLIQKEKGQPGLPDPPNGDPEVRYLTLPGIDYLDVRQLADVCRESGCLLTSTGFQSGGEKNPHVARAKVREQSLIDAGHISINSHTFPRPFQDIAHADSQAYRELKRKGPFHIINIDACGSIAPPEAKHAQRLIDAIYRTVELQLDTMNGRWLLFITTDVRPNSIAGETLTKLRDVILSNADANKNFRRQAIPLLDPEEVDIRLAAERASKNIGERFLCLFSLGLAKWLIELASGMHWDMKTHPPFCYSTMPQGSEIPSMMCLAFEFLPRLQGLPDPFGIARAQPALATEREDMSVRAADMIGRMSNVDSQMKSDEPLRTRMIENLRNSLEEAGYDPEVLEGIGT